MTFFVLCHFSLYPVRHVVEKLLLAIKSNGQTPGRCSVTSSCQLPRVVTSLVQHLALAAFATVANHPTLHCRGEPVNCKSRATVGVGVSPFVRATGHHIFPFGTIRPFRIVRCAPVGMHERPPLNRVEFVLIWMFFFRGRDRPFTEA